MPVKSLANLCLDGLQIWDQKFRQALFNPCIHEITVPLNYNNDQSLVTSTLSRFDLHSCTICSMVPKTRRRRKNKEVAQLNRVDQVIILTQYLTPIRLLQIWCILKAFHTSERYTVILHAIKSKILTPELGITLVDLMNLVNRETLILLQPWDKHGLLTTSLQTKLTQLICIRADQQQTEAPCLTIFKIRFLDEWCPVCIYRWAEFEELHRLYNSCCKGLNPRYWCDRCDKMRKNINWASIVHLLAI
jgi:hypothetical protein